MEGRSRRPIGLALGLAAALAVSACGGGSATPTSTPAPTDAPATAAATEAPAAISPSAGDGVAPTEKLIASDGRIVVFPPGWWTKEDLGIVYVASSEDAASRLVGTSTLSPGDAYVQFSSNTITSGGTTDPAMHLPEYLSTLLAGLGMTGGAPTTLTVAGKPAARLDASNAGLEIIALSVKENDETFADVIAYGAPGEKAALEAAVLGMVEGLTYPGA